MGRKIRLLLLYGGRSTEHAISCISAGSVLRAVDPDRYEVTCVGITRAGRWVLGPTDPAALSVAGTTLPEVDARASAVVLPPDPTSSALAVLAGSAPPDVVFPLLHGRFGEDGTVQGLLDLAGLPYVGSGVFASAACLDKAHMKRLLAASGLPVGPWQEIDADADGSRAAAQVAGLGWPLFVKPARGGSSIGITRVERADQLDAALVTARAADRKVIVEAAVTGREIECGVLGGRVPQASVPAEIHLAAGSAFYDFDAKYVSDATSFDVPAALPATVLREVHAQALAAFGALDCSGLARVDFFVTDSGVLVNEVNTMPGFTPVSMFPRMWAASGVSYPELIDRLVTDALERGPAG